MYMLTILTPMLFFLGSATLFLYNKRLSSVLMAIGFFLVAASVVLPLIVPVSFDVMKARDDVLYSVPGIINFVSIVGRLGSLLSVVGFLLLVYDFVKINKSDSNNQE